MELLLPSNLRTAASLGPQRFEALRAGLESAGRSFPFWSALYNPHGKRLLVELAESAPWEYVARMHDLDAAFRLVALRALIGAQGVASEDVPQFLAGDAKRYGDPYSGGAMGWDGERRQLYFEPRATTHLRDVGGVARRFSAGLI